MKVLFACIISIAVAALLVTAGWRLGYRHRLHLDAESGYAMQAGLLGAERVAKQLDDLQSGDIAELRDNLALQLYGHVMVMEMHWDYAHFSHRDAAQPILRFIAAHRADWSTNYKAGGLPYECNRLMGQKIDAMLIRSKEPQK